MNTYEREQVYKLGLNDIAPCKIILIQPIAADSYETNHLTGPFIVADRITNNTVGTGMTVGVSRRDEEDIERRNVQLTLFSRSGHTS